MRRLPLQSRRLSPPHLHQCPRLSPHRRRIVRRKPVLWIWGCPNCGGSATPPPLKPPPLALKRVRSRRCSTCWLAKPTAARPLRPIQARLPSLPRVMIVAICFAAFNHFAGAQNLVIRIPRGRRFFLPPSGRGCVELRHRNKLSVLGDGGIPQIQNYPLLTSSCETLCTFEIVIDFIKYNYSIIIYCLTSCSCDWTRTIGVFHLSRMKIQELQTSVKSRSLQLCCCMNAVWRRSTAALGRGAVRVVPYAKCYGWWFRMDSETLLGTVAVDKRGSILRSPISRHFFVLRWLIRVSDFVPAFVGLPYPFATFPGVAQRVYR